jgi:hypothetical protein
MHRISEPGPIIMLFVHKILIFVVVSIDIKLNIFHRAEFEII